jgi:GxxExxY protein
MLNGKPEWNQITAQVIAGCFAVHSHLGPGLLESVYKECLEIELRSRGLLLQREVPFPMSYRGVPVASALRLDFLVQDLVVLEVKAVERIHPVHEAQTLTYLRLSRRPIGLLVNFTVPLLRDGIKRFVMGGMKPPLP